jgi:hypothetical protein
MQQTVDAARLAVLSTGGNKSARGLLHFCTPFRGSAIGSTPAFGAGYPGSSPGPGATSLQRYAVLDGRFARRFRTQLVRRFQLAGNNPTAVTLPNRDDELAEQS